MSVRTIEQFLALLTQANIVEDRYIVAARNFAKSETDSKALARKLVKDEILTKWQAKHLLLGRNNLTIGKYALLDRLGNNGESRVYLAKHVQMDRRVIISAIRRGSDDGEAIKRFHRRANRIAGLNHQNLVHVFDFDHETNHCYLVTEHVDGVSIDRAIQNSECSLRDIVDYTYQAAEGLAHAHRHGVFHGRLTADQVRCDANNRTKVVGVGITDLAGSSNGNVISSTNESSDAARIDIRALGVIFENVLQSWLEQQKVNHSASGEPIAHCLTVASEMRSSNQFVLMSHVASALRDLLNQSSRPAASQDTVENQTVGETNDDALDVMPSKGRNRIAYVVAAIAVAIVLVPGWAALRILAPGVTGLESDEQLAAQVPGKEPAAIHPVASIRNPKEKDSRNQSTVSSKSPLTEQINDTGDNDTRLPTSISQSASPERAGDETGSTELDEDVAPKAAPEVKKRLEAQTASPPSAKPAKNKSELKQPAAAGPNDQPPPDELDKPDKPDQQDQPDIFQALPASVELPSINTSERQDLLPIGPIYLNGATCHFDLLGSDMAHPGSHTFQLQRGDSAGTYRVNLVSTASSISIARFMIREEQLHFQWGEATSARGMANYLRNCILRIRQADKSHTIALRQAEEVADLEIDLNRAMKRVNLRVPWLPDAEAIKFEVLKLSDELGSPDVAPSENIALGETMSVILGPRNQKPLRLSIDLKTKRVLQLTLSPWYRLAPEQPWQALTKSSFANTAALVERTQRNKPQLKNELLELRKRLYKKMTQAQKVDLKAQHDAQLRKIDDMIDWFSQLRLTCENLSDSARIQYRVYFVADAVEVNLVRSTGQEKDSP